jgi:hypothetical protein
MTKFAVFLSLCPFLHAADALELARSAAPEFFADTVLRLVEGGKIPDRQSQLKLLDDAFAAASGAQQPTPLAARFGTPPETRAMYRSRASESGLDALSLQSRVLKSVLALDPAKARELFQRISKPAIEPRGCEDPLVPDVSPYYQIASALLASFTTGEKETGAQVQFLQALLAEARSPNELAPLARAIQSIELNREQSELLLNSLAAKLEEMEPDFRPFALSIGDLRTEIAGLAGRARALALPTNALARGFRRYLVNQLTAPHCNEDLGDANQAVKWFNAFLVGDLLRIGEEEIRPDEQTDPPKVPAYFESDDSKPLGGALTRLQFHPEGRPRTLADRSTVEWRDLEDDFLRDVAAWQPPGSSVDVLHQKAYVLRAVLDLTPPGESRDRVLAQCVTLLQSSQAERQSPAEWLWQVKRFLQASAGDVPKLIEAFRNSGDPGLLWFATASQ